MTKPNYPVRYTPAVLVVMAAAASIAMNALAGYWGYAGLLLLNSVILVGVQWHITTHEQRHVLRWLLPAAWCAATLATLPFTNPLVALGVRASAALAIGALAATVVAAVVAMAQGRRPATEAN